jgi:hypothetical protein
MIRLNGEAWEVGSTSTIPSWLNSESGDEPVPVLQAEAKRAYEMKQIDFS